MKGSYLEVVTIIAAGAAVGATLIAAVMGATPPPTATSTVEIPYSGSVKDAAGATWRIEGTARVSKEEAPTGIVFGAVTTGVNDEVVVARPSGWICTLHGSGFPITGTRRLQVAGRIAPTATLIWNANTVQFTVPPGPPSTTGPVTGPFEVFAQENGVWRLLGRGGVFTILPDAPAAVRKR